MNQGVSYRGYAIHNDGAEYVAEPEVGDGECFEISSNTIKGLYRAIDELWTHLSATTDFRRTASVPAWYQAWLDDGADGRVRVFDSGAHESISPSRRWWGLGKLMAGAMACAVAFVTVPKLDANGDGSIDTEDWKAAVEKVYLKYPPKNSVHHIRWGQRVYDVSLRPAPDDEVDFDADDVRINGVSLKRTSSATTTPGAGITPITVLR